MKFLGVLLLLVGVSFWTGLTGVFDHFLVQRVYHQWQAAKYASVDGQITRSKVTTHQDNDGVISRRLELSYRYQVGDQDYTGTRYRYGDMSSSDDSAQRLASQLPVGSRVTVYYNPADPGDAVLHTALEGSDLMLPLFLLPFNLLAIAGWVLVGTLIHRRISNPPAGGLTIRQLGDQLHLRVGGVSAGTAALLAAVLLAIFGCVGITFRDGLNPPIPTLAILWGCVCGGSVAAFGWTAGRNTQGVHDLILSPSRGTLTLPADCGRRRPLELPMELVTSLDLEERETVGDRQHTMTYYVPIVVYTNQAGFEHREALPRWYDGFAAAEFVQWLREQVRGGLPQTPDEPQPYATVLR